MRLDAGGELVDADGAAGLAHVGRGRHELGEGDHLNFHNGSPFRVEAQRMRLRLCPFGENRGVQTESGFSGAEKATRSARSETASVFLGGSRLKCAEGQRP